MELTSIPELLRPFRDIGTLEMLVNACDFYSRPRNLTSGKYYQYLKQFFVRYIRGYDGDPPAPTSVGHLLLGDGSFDYHPAAVLAALSVRPSAITIGNVVPQQLLVSSVFFQDVAQNLEHLTIIVSSTKQYHDGDIWDTWYSNFNLLFHYLFITFIPPIHDAMY